MHGSKSMETNWESELASLLTDLSAVQDEMLAVLGRKRELLVAGKSDGLAEVAAEEERLVGRLQDCLDRRAAMLQRAAHEGLPADSIRSLADSLPPSQRKPLAGQVKVAAARARLLRHHALTNWVLVQRTLIHLSQMLEILATGGRLQPTYGKGVPAHSGGALVDREA
jgi:flagellar biosynthesis/type III secretory pathway chaperone